MGKKNNNQNGKFHPAKTPEGRRKQHFAIEAKKKQSLQRGKGQTSRKSSQQSVSTECTYGNHVFVNYYPHFRKYKINNHPVLIDFLTKHNQTGEIVYGYRDVTHSKQRGRHKNQIISPNPDTSDSEPMCIRRGHKFDIPNNFSDLPLPWIYPASEKSDEYGDGSDIDEKK